MRLTPILAMAALMSCSPLPDQAPESVTSIYWSDGDSGRINGERFRLANIDAPETGAVGTPNGAKCELERERGYAAKAFIVELTRDARLTITGRYRPDRYNREVIDLSANGIDVAAAGEAAGHLAPWPHRDGRALAPKPDWCQR